MSNLALNKSLEVLEDLRVLSPSSSDRLLDQLDYYLNHIQTPNGTNSSDNTFNKIVDVLDNQVKFIIENFYKVRPEIKNLQIENSIEEKNLKARELLFDNIDLVLKAADVLGLMGNLAFKISASEVSLTGLVNLEDISEAKKINIYKLTRMFLKKKILFTYKLVKSDSAQGGLAIELLFDLAHLSGPIRTSDNFFLFNQLNKYEIDFEKFYKLKTHFALEITDEMHLIKYKSISDAVKLSKCNKIIVHFPFLFRHISLIIPNREEFAKNSNSKKLNELVAFDFFSIFND